MLFNSIEFLVFFPIVAGLFFIIPKKFRCLWLLIASYYFYMSWNPKYAVLIAFSTFITYISGILMERANTKHGKQAVVAASFIINLAILGVFKYANFALQTLSDIGAILGLQPIERRLDLLLPVGISFYTFQALSYTIDVYRGTVKAEKNILQYMLFVSFFPQLVAGPIERSGNLLSQIQRVKEINVWEFERVRNGFLLMCWGLFQKLVIADRASVLVNQVYQNYGDYGFLELAIASVLFAVNIKEFWRRWHVSLTSWFTDYLYIPLGGSRKGAVRKYLNILIVFMVSGLWHGASCNFVAWGFLHAVYQISGDLAGKWKKRIGVQDSKNGCFSRKLEKGIVTFVLADAAWVFFASDSLHHACDIFRQMVTSFQTTSIYEIGLDRGNWFILCFGILLLFVVDVIHEKDVSVFQFLQRQTVLFRWTLYLGLIWSIILFGIYGAGYDSSQFIYFQF